MPSPQEKKEVSGLQFIEWKRTELKKTREKKAGIPGTSRMSFEPESPTETRSTGRVQVSEGQSVAPANLPQRISGQVHMQPTLVPAQLVFDNHRTPPATHSHTELDTTNGSFAFPSRISPPRSPQDETAVYQNFYQLWAANVQHAGDSSQAPPRINSDAHWFGTGFDHPGVENPPVSPVDSQFSSVGNLLSPPNDFMSGPDLHLSVHIPLNYEGGIVAGSSGGSEHHSPFSPGSSLPSPPSSHFPNTRTQHVPHWTQCANDHIHQRQLVILVCSCGRRLVYGAVSGEVVGVEYTSDQQALAIAGASTMSPPNSFGSLPPDSPLSPFDDPQSPSQIW